MGRKAKVTSHGARAVVLEAEQVQVDGLRRRLLDGTLVGDPAAVGSADVGDATMATEHALAAQNHGRRKTTLLDAAKTFLEENGGSGERSTIEDMGLEEQQFIKMCIDVSERVMNIRALFDDVDQKVQRKMRDIDAKRESRRIDADEEEHFSFGQYQAWLRQHGKIDDAEPGEIGEGNLLPILAVLEGECDALVTRAKRFRRVGDYFVDEAEIIGDENFDDEDFPTLQTRTRASQTDPFDADAMQQAMTELQKELTSVREQLALKESRVAQLELFRDSAMRRLVALRESAVRLQDQQEAETRRMITMLSEAMSQNERLVKKMDAWVSNERLGAEKKEKVQKQFTQQLVRLRFRAGILAQKMERQERQLMQAEDDYAYQSARFEVALSQARSGKVEKRVWDQVDKLNYSLLEHGAGCPGGTTLFNQVRLSAEEHIPPELSAFYVSAVESLFKNADFNCFGAVKNAIKLVGAQDGREMVETVRELQDVVPMVREAIANSIGDIIVATADFLAKLKDRNERAKHLLQERHAKELKDRDAATERAVERAKENQAKLHKGASTAAAANGKPRETMSTGVNTDTTSSDSNVADLPPPRMAAIDLPSDISVEHPQDVLQLIHGYLVDLIVESAVVAHVAKQKLSSRIEGLYNVLYLIRTLIPKVSTGSGLCEGMTLAETEATVADGERAAQQWWTSFEAEGSKSISILRAVKDANWKQPAMTAAFAIAGDGLAPVELGRYKKLLHYARDHKAASDVLARAAAKKKKAAAAKKKAAGGGKGGKGGGTQPKEKDGAADGAVPPDSDGVVDEAPPGSNAGLDGAPIEASDSVTPAATPVVGSLSSPSKGPKKPRAKKVLKSPTSPAASAVQSPPSMQPQAQLSSPLSATLGSEVNSLASMAMSRGPQLPIAAAATQTTPRLEPLTPSAAALSGGGRFSPWGDTPGPAAAVPATTTSADGSPLASSRKPPTTKSTGGARTSLGAPSSKRKSDEGDHNHAPSSPMMAGRTRSVIFGAAAAADDSDAAQPQTPPDALQPAQYVVLRARLESLRRGISELCRGKVPSAMVDIDASVDSIAAAVTLDAELVDALATAVEDEVRRQSVESRRRPTLAPDDALPPLSASSGLSGSFARGSSKRSSFASAAAAVVAATSMRRRTVGSVADKAIMCDLLSDGGVGALGSAVALSADGIRLAIESDWRAFSSQRKARAASKNATATLATGGGGGAEVVVMTDGGLPALVDTDEVAACNTPPPPTAPSAPLLALRRLSPSRSRGDSKTRASRVGGGGGTPTRLSTRELASIVARTPPPSSVKRSGPLLSLGGKTITEIYQ